MQVDYWKKRRREEREKEGEEEASRQLPGYMEFAVRDSNDELTST